MRGLNSKIELNFVIAGHTKFMCNQMFGVFKKRFRVTKVSSPDEIAQVSLTKILIVNETSMSVTQYIIKVVVQYLLKVS